MIRRLKHLGQGARAWGLARGGPPTPPDPPANVSPPIITGTVATGNTLLCAPGVWTPDGVVYAYQWMLEGAPIPLATSSSYVVTDDELIGAVTCEVTASNVTDSASEISNALTADYQALRVSAPLDAWFYDRKTNVSDGQPVSAWNGYINNVALLQAGASSLCPTDTSTGVLFDRVDDRLNLNSQVAAFASKNFAVLFVLNVDGIDPSEVLFSVSKSTTTTGQYTFVESGRVVDSTSIRFLSTTLPAGKPIWLFVTPTAVIRRIDGVEVTEVTSTALIADLDRVTLGGRVQTSFTAPLGNSIRFFGAWSGTLPDATQRAAIEAELLDEGISF